MIGLITVSCFVVFVLLTYLITHRHYSQLTKEIIEPIKEKEKKLDETIRSAEEPVKKAEAPEEKPKVQHDPIPERGYLDKDTIQVIAPSADCHWLYKEENGIDVFVFRDFKIYAQGDIWVGSLDTKVKSELLFNKLVQKFACAALKNAGNVDLTMCVQPKPPKVTTKPKKKK